MTEITKEEFEALAHYPNRIVEERDVEYGYETVVSPDGRELAIASYHSYQPASYRLCA